MLNKFKLWFNRNSSRIIITIIIIVCGYATIKGADNYYKNRNSTQENNRVVSNQVINETNTDIEDSDNDINGDDTQIDDDDEIDYTGTQYYIDGSTEIPIVNNGTEEHTQVMAVMTKIMNLVYEADKSDDYSLKEDIFNMFTDELLIDLSTGEEYVERENILNYIFYIEDLSDYSIGTIYRYEEQNNIVRYGLLLKYQENDEEPQYGFTIINMDYDNNTFSYDGTLVSLNDIDDKQITEIKNKGSNTF